MKIVKPSDDLIDKLLNICADSGDSGKSIYPAMSYEQGVRDTVEWMLGETDDPPIPLDK